jgi:hypothetical protein
VALWSAGGNSPFWVGVYLMGMALIALVALMVGRETSQVGIEA